MQILEQIQTLDFPAPLPATLLAVEQRFQRPRVPDVPRAVRHTLEESQVLAPVAAGDTVAVGVGSRGIANLPTIVRAVIDCLQDVGARPFIVPAMGSHGGATAAGQEAILAGLGITREHAGAEIRASMEVVPIGRVADGPRLFQDANAAAADHTLLVNRVKPHTDFRGEIESGLAKMAVIGLGKQRGAEAMHAYGAAGFRRFLAPAARLYETRSNLRGGLAILENAYDETAEVVALAAPEIGGDKEIALQKRAKELLPGLLFPEIDVLVVRQIGKDKSGTGMDTNVIGRLMIPRQPENLGGPDIAVIAVLDLTAETHGNAAGLGLANITTARVLKKIDFAATYTNALTTGIFGMQRVSLPMTLDNDRQALQAAMRGCGQKNESVRMVLIEDTMAMHRMWVSPNLRQAVEVHPQLAAAGEVPLDFGPEGTMINPWSLG